MRCNWCNKEGHADCSEKMTFEELYEKVMSGDNTVRKLLTLACDRDHDCALEYGAGTSWEPKERGYALLWASICKQKVTYDDVE